MCGTTSYFTAWKHLPEPGTGLCAMKKKINVWTHKLNLMFASAIFLPAVLYGTMQSPRSEFGEQSWFFTLIMYTII